MKKYLIQIVIILIMLAVAWGLFTLGANKKEEENKPFEASIQRLPVSIDANIIPIRNWSIKEPDVLAQSAIVMNFKSNSEQGSVLYQKNINQVLPVASLTKIMTGIIVLESFNLEEIIKISKNSILTLGDKGGLVTDEELKVKDLLYVMLIESSNDAAMALTNDNTWLPYDDFVNLMNKKTKEIGLENTNFIDPAGLSNNNQSTAFDLVKLANYSLRFPILWEILRTAQATVYSIDNKFVHNLINTNTLLDKFSFLRGGKTGYTDEANGCMLTISIISGSFGDNYLITVVLGSSQRETDTETLITWAKSAHIW